MSVQIYSVKKLLALHITGTKTKNALSLSGGGGGWAAGIRKEFYKKSLTIKEKVKTVGTYV